ncbi:MAG: hypothetical protein Kow00122_07470 [Thermoleophilia bacterium]
MSGLLIVGAGGHASVVADIARQMGLWEEIAFLDDRYPDLVKNGDVPVLGPTNRLEELRDRFAEAVPAVGDNRARLDLYHRLEAAGYGLPLLQHPMTAVSPGARLAPGTVVVAMAAINTGAVLGPACIVNTGATVGHDCRLAEAVHAAPGCHLGGHSEVGARSWIGIGVSVREGVRIGADVMVGAGAAVVSDLPDGVLALGVPARVAGAGGTS